MAVDEDSVNRKYPMKVNGNKSMGKLKTNLIGLFIGNDIDSILNVLLGHFIKDTLPVRKNRSYERVRKNKQSKSKHRTFSNFKPAY